MILVLTGTQPIPFPRMISAVIQGVESADVGQAVVVQRGCTPVNSMHPDVTHFSWCSRTELNEWLRQADYVVTHGGTASIVGALRAECRVAVMPRLKKFGEHNDNHQQEIAQAFASDGYLQVWREGAPFIEVFELLKRFVPVKYTPSLQGITDAVGADIERFLKLLD